QRQYGYNTFGDLVSLTQSVGSFSTNLGATISMNYDTGGRIRTINYPGTTSVTYSYDAVGNVAQVILNRNGQSTAILSGMSYEPFGPLKGFSRGNGLGTTLSYDQAYRLTAINDPVYDTSFTYDANGNIDYQSRGIGDL